MTELIIATILGCDCEFDKDEKIEVVFYNIMVQCANHTWTVRKRYSQFRSNFLTMKESFPNSRVAHFPFPRRTIIPRSKGKTDDRIIAFGKYLEELLTLTPPPPEVISFLRIPKSVIGPILRKHAVESTGGVRIGSGGLLSVRMTKAEIVQRRHDDADEEEEEVEIEEHKDNASDTSYASDASSTHPEGSSPSPGGSRIAHVNSHNERAHVIPSLLSSSSGSLSVAGGVATAAHSSVILEEGAAEEEDENDYVASPPSNTISTDEIIVTLLFVSFFCTLKLLVLYSYLYFFRDRVHVVDRLTAILISAALNVRLVIKTMIFFCGIMFSAHRALGYLLGSYLRSFLMTKKGGFDLSFEWITVRLGLDKNEILISNFVWNNPPKYNKTPFFLKLVFSYLNN